ncbi:MAG TPA: serine hydrolase domain-containing protein [Bacillota bacterium]|nr:serine hydrolase domain-containing protein [Bacillota bacterium]
MSNNYNQALFDQITALIRQKMKSLRITGASVAIVDDEETIYAEGFGYADLKNRVPVHPGTIFKIGSITKVFTASGIMRLVEDGKIALDQPVKEYLPEFAVKSRFPETRPITVRDLLCHHSGLPCDDFRNYFSSDPEDYQAVMEYLPEAYVVAPPGRMFYYSNLGVDLLGVIIARITGMPYHRYMENLLKDLKMEKSAIVIPEAWGSFLSKPYAKGKEQVEGLMKEVPPGGISSTVEDMAKFMKSIISGGKGLFRNPNTLNAMVLPQYPDNPLDFNMVNGLGWFIGKPGLDDAGQVLWHDGGTPNFFSLMALIPERKLGITLLTNSPGGALMNHQVSIDILRLLLEAKYGLKSKEEVGKQPAPITPDLIRKTAGRFVTMAGMVTVSSVGDKLVARMPSGTFQMFPCQDGWFSVKLLLGGLIPLKLKQLSVIRLGIPQVNGERVFAMEQLGFRAPQGKEYVPLNTTNVWLARAGNYVCCNDSNPRFKSFKLQSSAEGMMISISSDKLGHLNLYLDVINDFEATIAGYGRYCGETIFSMPGRLKVFGLEFRKKK